MTSRNFCIIYFSILLLALLITPIGVSGQCKLQVSAVDALNQSLVDGVDFTLVDHKTLKTTKKRSKNGIADFDHSETGNFSLKAKAKGFLASAGSIPVECSNSPAKFSLVLLRGNADKTIFILSSNPNRDTDGKVFFDSSHIAVIGTSWPRPAYPSSSRCTSPCEITVAVEIDIDGNVTSAKALTGTQSLWKSTEDAAIKSKFKPVFFEGGFIPVRGIMRYIFN